MRKPPGSVLLTRTPLLPAFTRPILALPKLSEIPLRLILRYNKPGMMGIRVYKAERVRERDRRNVIISGDEHYNYQFAIRQEV